MCVYSAGSLDIKCVGWWSARTQISNTVYLLLYCTLEHFTISSSKLFQSAVVLSYEEGLSIVGRLTLVHFETSNFSGHALIVINIHENVGLSSVRRPPYRTV
jgi:hypothetical protein